MSAPFHQDYPHILYPQIVGMRDKIACDCPEADTDTLWSIISIDLPTLIEQLEEVVPPET